MKASELLTFSHTLESLGNLLYNKEKATCCAMEDMNMKNDLFGDKVKYEQFAPPFVLVALLNRFDNRYQSAADAFFKELSWKQMFFLNGITLHREPPTIKDMADFMGCSHQNVNKLYAKLLRDGYITSMQDENDRRKQRLFLTDKARDFLARNKTEAGKNVNDIFSVVSTDELETTIEVMAKLTDRLAELYG